MKGLKLAVKIILPLVIIAIGIGGVMKLQSLRHPPVRKAQAERGVLVEVLRASPEDRRVAINTTGTVEPAMTVSLTAEVDGRVTDVAPGFKTGRFFERGDSLFQIEDVDYHLALQKSKAALTKAEFDLAATESKARVAEREWLRLHPDNEQPENSLVLYGPQLKDARANVESARAGVRQAEIRLDRTRIAAPFNGFIRSEQVEIGQFIKTGNTVAQFAGSDEAEVVVAIPMDELKWLKLRGGKLVKGQNALVRLHLAEQTYQWQAQIDRLLGEVDPLGRMARIVVTIADPFGLDNSSNDHPPLVLGSFVDVTLQGKLLQSIIVLPRSALREGNTFWLVDEEDRLHIREVDILRIEEDRVFVGGGIAKGDRIVLTDINGGAEGLLLRIAQAEGQP